MADQRSGPIRGYLLADTAVAPVATVIERYVHAAQSRKAPVDRQLFDVLEDLRRYQPSCAAQLAQLSGDGEEPWWAPEDEIDVAEAARIMNCTTANIRKRAGKSLPAVKIGGQWVLSRAATELAAEARRSER